MNKSGRFGKYGEQKTREILKIKDNIVVKDEIKKFEHLRINPGHPGYRMRGHHK
jgi:hypothetical protein